MNNLIKAIQLKQELDSLRPLKKEDELRIMQKFRLDWNYHSNHLEGNSLTYGETKALILFGITAQGKPLKDHVEISGHNEAVEWILDIIKQNRPLSENFIRELHTLILKEPYEVDAITPDGKPTKKKINIGVYKKQANHVKTKTGEIFRFATPEETPAKMNDLVNWYQKEATQKDKNPILLSAEFHYKFIRIHPFDDGNGRTARILMNFILLQFGYPPVIIKTEDKENYYAALRQADARILEPFFDYITQNLIASLEIMIKGAKGENIDDPDDLDKKIALLEQKLKGVGKKIEVTKSKEVLQELSDNTISKVIDKFKKKGEKFEKFYSNSQLSIQILNPKFGNTEISSATKSIRLEYKYNAFTYAKLNEFNYTSEIKFNFQITKYAVFNSANETVYEKLYSEQLTEQEIDELINSEMTRHTGFIEQKIKEIKK